MDCQCGKQLDIDPWQWVAAIYELVQADDTRLLICLVGWLKSKMLLF